MLQGPPDGVCRAAQMRCCAAVDRPAAVAALSKMTKNAPRVQSENAPKRVKMAKNDQKLAKMAKKMAKIV